MTLAMVLGVRSSVIVYCAVILYPFCWIAGCVAAGTFPLWTLLVLLVLVPAVGNVRVMSRFSG